MSTQDTLSVDEFKHWLNDRRMADVSSVFHEIVGHYRAAIAAQAQQPDEFAEGPTPEQLRDEHVAQQAQGVPADFHSHRAAWRSALVFARDHAEVTAPDVDDRAYWAHEIAAFDRCYSELAAAPQAEPLSDEQVHTLHLELNAKITELDSPSEMFAEIVRDVEQALGIGTKGEK